MDTCIVKNYVIATIVRVNTPQQAIKIARIYKGNKTNAQGMAKYFNEMQYLNCVNWHVVAVE